MIITRVQDIVGTEREVVCPKGGFTSLRLLLESDGMGFTLTKTVVPIGGMQHWHYKEHLEACYCISGHGTLSTKSSEKFPNVWDVHEIEPGTMYALNKNEAHYFQAFDEVTLLCVFNPPLVGKEVHDEEGSYSAL